MSVRERVRKFVVDTFYVSDPKSLSDDDSLIVEGIVDSTGMLEVIGFLEKEFGISVADAETTPDNFETIGRITGFVERKRAPADPGRA